MKSAPIKLWFAEITATEADYDNYWQLLDQGERQHANNLKNERIRARYVGTHGRLRLLLADCLNVNPAQLRICKAEHGKPYLVDYPNLKFNLSHTSDKMLVAIGWNNELGVDIEVCKPRVNLMALVDKCFADEEKDYWQNLPEQKKTQAFYRFWTHKEAFVKATGKGIALGLNRCVINPDNSSEFLRIPLECGNPEEWLAYEINVDTAISATLVVQGRKISGIQLNNYAETTLGPWTSSGSPS